jgi:hypothetical protein
VANTRTACLSIAKSPSIQLCAAHPPTPRRATRGWRWMPMRRHSRGLPRPRRGPAAPRARGPPAARHGEAASSAATSHATPRSRPLASSAQTSAPIPRPSASSAATPGATPGTHTAPVTFAALPRPRHPGNAGRCSPLCRMLALRTCIQRVATGNQQTCPVHAL